MGSRIVVLAVCLSALACTAQVWAQSREELPAHPLDLQLAPTASTSIGKVWRDTRLQPTQTTRFEAMFAKQAQNGDPRRVPMYLLMPFAKVTPSEENAAFAPHATHPSTQPNVVSDVGALVRTLRSGD